MPEESMFPTLAPEVEEDKPAETPAGEQKPEADKVTEQEPDTKTASETSQAAEETGEGAEKAPALILGKFKSQADLEKAYKALERKYGKTASELATLKAQQPQKPAEPEKDELEEFKKMDPQAWVDALSQGPKAVLDLVEKVVDKRTAAIREQVLTQRYETEVEKFRRTHPDLGEYEADMVEFFQEYPVLAQDARGLELAYKIAKANRVTETLPVIGESVAKSKAASEAAKVAARLPGGVPPKKDAKEPTPEEAMRAALLSADKQARGIFG